MIDFSPLWISLRIAAIATLITGILGIVAAHFMQRYRGRWRSLLEGLFLAPMVLPPTVLGFLLLLLLGRNGPLGTLLSYTGINIVFTWYAAVLTATVVAFPLMYKTTLSAFEQIDSRLQQAASTLGASEQTVFFRITLPLSLPGLLAGLTLAFARALGEFGATLMLAGNIPGRTQTLPMAIYFAVESGNFREAAFWSALVLGISLGGILVVNSSANRRLYQHSFFKKLFEQLFDRRFNQRLNQSSRRLEQAPIEQAPSSEGQITAISPTPHSQPHLEVNICKHLSSYKLTVNFVANEQEPLGFLGASGAGKSLILRCIAGIETPDSGRIVLNGRVLFDSKQGINLPSCDRKVGILFQNYALFPHLTIAQNVAFGLPQKLSPTQIRAAVGQQLAAVQLESLAQRYPHELSGGQQQRVALARALANEPEALLLDEPFSALDTHLRSQIEQQLSLRLRRYHGITLLVTHNLEEAYRICHQLLILNQGNLIAHSPKHDIFEQPRTVRVAQLTGCKNFSPAVAINEKTIEARRWQCRLETVEPVAANLTQVGIRAHQITFLRESESSSLPNSFPNTFDCWLAATSETPHRMTLYLKLHHPSKGEQDYHLQAEVFKEKWRWLKDQPFPWQVRLDPLRLLLLTEDDS
ncbi:molybdate ABC transporter, permease protein, putative [Synechococcus sp. PCC 7335]|uniref:molybdate ABC transporter permease subunit n=1 Tax=Synechococcus sp. (strain ATCC 29403 / PCC 7335) TaxID=91464 RepID=UPI00017EBC92|nr:molybdate ABC transporter permease subunit [Synechococcus sp. PCC 7335]EDX87560.1 molybdate ABC transporter, permease protein, putative [Synechococcus sp. PCC 7335]